MTENFRDRLVRIRDEIELAENFDVHIGHDAENEPGRYFFQIQCWRKDVITREMGWGYGGKAYLSEHATDSELVQTIFGLYRSYWEHEARETFMFRGRRIFGPHLSVEALWEIASRVDVRSAKHVEDQPLVPPAPIGEPCEVCGVILCMVHQQGIGLPSSRADEDDLGMEPSRDRHHDFGGSVQ